VAAAPAARSGTPEKTAKGKAADTKISAKDAKKGSAKLAAADTTKTPAKVAKTSAGDKSKTAAAAKPAAPAQGTKVAKSGNGRRG
jgi:hypothetical protein